jgi:hypothetical protein
LAGALCKTLRTALKRAPRGALREFAKVARNVKERAALADLWWLLQRSIKRGQGRIFKAAGKYLARRWEMSRRTADRFIHRLEEMGVIEVVDRGWRHGPRTVRLYVVPKPVVCLEKIRRDRAEVKKRQVRSGCAHSITEDRAILPPPNQSDPCFTVSDDPEGVWAGEISPDPFPELLVACVFAPYAPSEEVAIGFLRPPGEPADLYPPPFERLPADNQPPRRRA